MKTCGRAGVVISVVLASLALCAPFASAAPGDFDTTFSGDGKLTTDLGGDDFGSSVALQSDGKIVVAGTKFTGPDEDETGDFAVTRYNADGSLDTTFSGDGKQTTDLGADDDATAVAVQPDGKIVVAGETTTTSGDSFAEDAAVVRYNADGSLDTSFSGDGKQVSDLGGEDNISAIALQSDGKIVLAGGVETITDDTSTTDFVVARYTTDGSLDSSFSGDGKQTINFGGTGSAYGVALQSDGKIVVSGDTNQDPDVYEPDFAVARLDTDGSLDTSFSGDGKQTTDFGHIESGDQVAINGDGKIFVGGFTGDGDTDVSGDFALARYNPDGSLDTSFSGDGKQTTNFGDLADLDGMALQSDGRVVVAGTIDNRFDPDLVLARFDTDGAVDSTFFEGGRRIADFASGASVAGGVALQPDGKIVLAGGAGGDFGLARFQGGVGVPDTTPPQTTITGGPTGTTSDSTPTFSFVSSELGSSFQCRVDSHAYGPCESPQTVSTLAPGTHTFYVRATDFAGNSDPTPASRSFTVSATKPKPKPKPKPTTKPPAITPGSTTDPPSIPGSKSAGSAKVSSKGAFTLSKPKVDCTGTGPDCSVKASVTASLPASKASASAKRKTVKLGKGSFKVKAGKKGKVKLKLTKKGLKLLKRLKRVKAKVKITVKRGGKTAKKTVTVKLKAPKRKR